MKSSEINTSRSTLVGMPPAELETLLASSLSGFRRFQAAVILKWLYKRKSVSFIEMSDLARQTRVELAERYSIDLLQAENILKSQDGSAKFRFVLSDGKAIESVYIPERKRHTLCISSQIGCARNCLFCHTATLKLQRNLTAAEMVGQLLAAEKMLGPVIMTNLVFMGMGEPFDNWAEVQRAIAVFSDDRCLAKSRKRIVVSTAGHVPGIRSVGSRAPFRLCVSLHAADDETRNQLMPINKSYPLKELIPAITEFAKKQRDRVTIEYVLLKDVNVSLGHAKALHRLLANVPNKINLIPFNAYPGALFECATTKEIEVFSDYLIQKGHLVIIRKSRGGDILGACGQLAGSQALANTTLSV